MAVAFSLWDGALGPFGVRPSQPHSGYVLGLKQPWREQVVAELGKLPQALEERKG